MSKPEAATESQMARDQDATNFSRTFKYLMGQLNVQFLVSFRLEYFVTMLLIWLIIFVLLQLIVVCEESSRGLIVWFQSKIEIKFSI